MSTPIRALAFSSLLLCLGACSEKQAQDAKAGAANAIDQVHEGANQAAAAMAATWDKMSTELGTRSKELETMLANATPEMKARLQGLADTFHAKMDLARQKFEEAKAAAPEKAAELQKQAVEAYEAAKQAFADASAK